MCVCDQVLLRAASFIAKLRDALQAALRIDTTTHFANAKAAWDGIQKLLLESVSVDGVADIDVDDLPSAKQLLLKRSVMSDVKEKLIEATANQWEDWLEFSLFQAEQLGLDYHEEQEVRDVVANARAVYANITSTKQALVDALAEDDRRSPRNLRTTIAAATSIGWKHAKVDEAIALEARVTKASAMAHAAWQQLDRAVMRAAIEECRSVGLDSEDMALCVYLVGLQEKAFLNKAHRLFQFLGRSDLVTDITMTMKDMFFATAGDMFHLKHFPNLRGAEEFGRAASSMGFRNTEVAEKMLAWSGAPLPTSLTKMDLVANPKVNEMLLKKVMKQLWQCVQGFLGDIVFSYPAMLAQEIIKTALEYPALKDEIYCLCIKQLNKNPSPSSEAKALDLIQICLQSFAPSEVFANYLEYSLRVMGQEALVRQLHVMSAEANLQDKQLSLADIGRVTGLVVVSGWLQLRQEGVFNSYKAFWFLLDPEAGKLRYFANEATLKQKQLSSYDIRNMTSLDALEPSEKASRNPSIRGKFPFEFGQSHTGRKVRVVSDTEAERSNWIAALRACKNASWAIQGGKEDGKE